MGESFGEFLRALRMSNHLTLRQVEERVNVSIGYLSQIEQGERGVPHLKILEKLAEAYNVPVENLVRAASKQTKGTTRGKSRAAILLSMIESLESENKLPPSMRSPKNEYLQEGYESLTYENKQRLIDYLDLLLLKQQYESRQLEQDT
jgi:transcriptional regulator with XRE-family HTH domain